jgi:hypothetical protein
MRLVVDGNGWVDDGAEQIEEEIHLVGWLVEVVDGGQSSLLTTLFNINIFLPGTRAAARFGHNRSNQGWRCRNSSL